MSLVGISTSPPPSATTIYFGTQSKTQTTPTWVPSVLNHGVSRDTPLSSSSLKLKSTSRFAAQLLPKISLRCNSSNTPGENENKFVLDAFFLGKALGEALGERVDSTVGEFLSSLGRLQAEQQKQVQELQEEVMERAKRAKERVAREAMEAQGLNSRESSTVTVSSAADAFSNSSASISDTDPDLIEQAFFFRGFK